MHSLMLVLTLVLIPQMVVRAEDRAEVAVAERHLVNARGEPLDLRTLAEADSRLLWTFLDDRQASWTGVIVGRLSDRLLVVGKSAGQVRVIASGPFGRQRIPIFVDETGGFQIVWPGNPRPFRLDFTLPGTVGTSAMIPYQGNLPNWAVWLGTVPLVTVDAEAKRSLQIHLVPAQDEVEVIQGAVLVERSDDPVSSPSRIAINNGMAEPLDLAPGSYRIHSDVPGWSLTASTLLVMPGVSRQHQPLVLIRTSTVILRQDDGQVVACELSERPKAISLGAGYELSLVAREGGELWEAAGIPVEFYRAGAKPISGLRLQTAVVAGDRLHVLSPTRRTLEVLEIRRPVAAPVTMRAATAEEKNTAATEDAIVDGSPNLRHGGGDFEGMLWVDGLNGRFTVPTTGLPPGIWYLHALYASGESRLCQVEVDGVPQAQGFAAVTSGFTMADTRADVVGPLWLEPGACVQVAARGYMPHFHGFLWSRVAHLKLPFRDFTEGPPRSNF
jgi:hypothetical protein